MLVPRPSHVAAWLLPSWMICSSNQGRAYFEFQMLGREEPGRNLGFGEYSRRKWVCPQPLPQPKRGVPVWDPSAPWRVSGFSLL